MKRNESDMKRKYDDAMRKSEMKDEEW
jgi:hypothetical protein